MADANLTLITRAQMTSLITPATGRFRLTLDGQSVELGTTGFRDVSALLDPALVGTITAGMLVVIRTGNHVTIKINVTPIGSGEKQITKTGSALGTAFAPDTTEWFGGRGGPVGISSSGHVYINPAVGGQKVDATMPFGVDNTWPTALPGVEFGQPVVV